MNAKTTQNEVLTVTENIIIVVSELFVKNAHEKRESRVTLLQTCTLDFKTSTAGVQGSEKGKW